MKKLLLMFLLALPCFVFGQTVTLTGKVSDPENLPLEAATVYLNSAKDSTLVDYTLTSKNGQFTLKTKATNNPVYLKVSFMGFATYKQKLESVTKDTDFGTIKMEDKGTTLNEVVIESEIPPVRVKKDTLEFNAGSFAVRPDANLQELLKQLPGLEIDAEGKITVNGKEVSQILVNGKPFFDKDGKIALQNLPAEIINKIQVTAKKTKEEEQTGQEAKGNEASINITIDEEKNKGMFGRATTGFGTSGRYEHSALVNYFKGDRKISLLASTNNINSTGFSMDEIFDNMSGGRNMSAWSDGKSYNINGMQFGGSTGIIRSDIFGANYADKWAKGFDGALNYFYTAADTRNNNQSKVTTFIPETPIATDNSYISESSGNSKNNRYGHYYNTQFEIKPDSTVTIYVEPKFQKGYNKSDNESSSRSYRLSNGQTMNENSGLYSSENNTSGFSNMLVASKKFKSKKGRFLSLDANNDNQKGDNYDLVNTVTDTYDYSSSVPVITPEIRNQLRRIGTTKDTYSVALSYGEPVSDSTNVYAQMEVKRENESERRRGYRFNGITNNYTDFDDALSGYLSSKTDVAKPTVGFNSNTGKAYFNVEAGANVVNYKANGNYLGQELGAASNFVLPVAEVQLNYHFTKTRHMWLSYEYEFDTPNASQVLEVANVFNPLTTSIGNSNLQYTKNHGLYFNLYDYNWAEKTGYSIYAGGHYNERSIATSYQIDDNARSVISYVNVSGTYNYWAGANYNKAYKKDAHSLNLGLGLYFNGALNKGLQNEESFISKTLNFEPQINLTYKYGELFTVTPQYSFEYQKTNYSNYSVSGAESFWHRLSLATTSYWPKHIVFGNDLSYNYNSQQTSFRKSYYLWNTSLGYNFWKDKLTFKVKVYDMLNQNLGANRSITPTGISEEMNTVLKRYAMFSLSIKLDKFAGKKDAGASAAGSVISF
ncbi:MAG: carboxypeptidase-like regulatory domain-containing protein [Bacteroidia bacterium]